MAFPAPFIRRLRNMGYVLRKIRKPYRQSRFINLKRHIFLFITTLLAKILRLPAKTTRKASLPRPRLISPRFFSEQRLSDGNHPHRRPSLQSPDPALEARQTTAPPLYPLSLRVSRRSSSQPILQNRVQSTRSQRRDVGGRTTGRTGSCAAYAMRRGL